MGQGGPGMGGFGPGGPGGFGDRGMGQGGPGMDGFSNMGGGGQGSGMPTIMGSQGGMFGQQGQNAKMEKLIGGMRNIFSDNMAQTQIGAARNQLENALAELETTLETLKGAQDSKVVSADDIDSLDTNWVRALKFSSKQINDLKSDKGTTTLTKNQLKRTVIFVKAIGKQIAKVQQNLDKLDALETQMDADTGSSDTAQ
ncbi:hypothetical protein HYR82_03925 [Candidatus Peregrinibacteria bacterium]|nr:hypothetical protein [Candidatus Peregrinibacteria bacterium]